MNGKRYTPPKEASRNMIGRMVSVRLKPRPSTALGVGRG